MGIFRDQLCGFISDYVSKNGDSPSFSQMTEAMGISPRSKSLITRSLRLLEKEGKIKLIKEGRRVLIKLSDKHIPLLGRISAGVPIEAIPESQNFDIEDLFSGSDRFALQVKGTSMIDEGILDGDIIICMSRDTAKEGDIVVALIDEHHTTLKRISYKVKNMITLIPANAELKPRAYMPERICIQGIYVGLIRMNR